MALTNNFLPNTSLVFGVRDFAPQIDALQKGDTEGLQNAFKFGTQVYDAIKNRQIADEMEKDNPDYKKIDALAAKRINSPDTSFSNWRWKQGQDQQKALREEELNQAKAEKEAAKELAKRQILNKVTNTLGTINLGLNTTPEQAQQYRNTLAGLMTEAQNAGVEDLSSITNAMQKLDEPLPYEQMEDLKNQWDLYNKNYESVTGEGTYGSNKDYATYVKNLDDIWYKASPEMRKNREFRLAYETAKAAHAPKKKTPPKFRRK